jgi:hypothetical protein
MVLGPREAIEYEKLTTFRYGIIHMKFSSQRIRRGNAFPVKIEILMIVDLRPPNRMSPGNDQDVFIRPKDW